VVVIRIFQWRGYDVCILADVVTPKRKSSGRNRGSPAWSPLPSRHPRDRTRRTQRARCVPVGAPPSSASMCRGKWRMCHLFARTSSSRASPKMRAAIEDAAQRTQRVVYEAVLLANCAGHTPRAPRSVRSERRRGRMGQLGGSDVLNCNRYNGAPFSPRVDPCAPRPPSRGAIAGI